MRLRIFLSKVILTASAVLVSFVGVLVAQPRQLAAIPQGAIVIDLDRNGALRLDQQPIELPNLTDRLHNISATRIDATVVIVAAADVAFKELVNTVEAVRGAGIERVGILKQKDGSLKESLPPVGATVLSVDRSGIVRMDGKKMKVKDVAAQLQKVFKRRNDRTVYVQAYGTLSFDAVGNVIDAAKAAGASRIALLASSE